MSLRICRVEAWSGCKGWKSRQSSKIISAQHCCDGRKHNGNKLCNIPSDVTSDPVNSNIFKGSKHAAENRRKISAETFIVKRQVSSCGGYRTAQTETTTLTSPNFPSSYENNLRCLWTIEAPVNYVIVFQIIYLDLEENNACSFDYLSINLGGPLPLETNKICTNKTNDLSFITRSNNASIAFVTDGSVTRRGFSVQYKAVLNCGKHLTAKTSRATLTSPLYPSQYENYINCLWTIEGPVNSTIILQITYVDLEETTDCSLDYIQIYLGQRFLFETDRICRKNMKDLNYISRYNEADVIFVTDSSVVKTGFSLQYYAATNCGGRLQAMSTSATLYSPSYPHQYDNNLYCHWTIEGSAGSRIVIEIAAIDFEENNGCSYDYLQIYLGENNILETGRICKYNSTDSKFITRSDKADVIFVTDGSIQKTGFSLSYKTVSRCGEYLTADTATSRLTSPRYPSEYEDNLFCLWTIKAPINSRITLNIEYLDIEANGDYCSFDFLQIYLGSHYILKTKRICGRNTTGLIFVSGSNEADVLFITDGSVTKTGFNLQYHAVSSCGGHLTAGIYTATLSSPNYPLEYDNYLRCHWIIEAPINYRVVINITDIDLEESSYCSYDYIQIYLGNNYILETKRICRKYDTSLNSISMSDIVHVIFITDGSITKRGFYLHYQAVSPFTHVQTSPYKVIENQPLNVTCALNSNQPAGHISWFPSGEGSVPSILYFSSVAKNNRGIYTCTIKITLEQTIEGQQTGTNASQIDVDVFYPPSIQMMTSTYKVIEYQPLNVTCQVSSNPPPDNIFWFPPGESSISSMLYISSLSRNQSGIYSCTAKTTMTPTAGEQQIGISTSQIQVDVLYSPSIQGLTSTYKVIEYQSLNITCQVNSNPPADQIFWSPSGESSSQSRLYFSSVSRNKSGSYSCTAQNTMAPTAGRHQTGMNTSQIQVDVLYPPSIQWLPSPYKVIEYQTLNVTCQVSSNPPPGHISWSPSAESSVSSRLYFSSVSRNQSRTYSCTAQNVMVPTSGEIQCGMNATQMQVDVLYPPLIEEMTSPFEVIEYQSLNVTCHVDSNPLPDQISWSPMGESSVSSRLYFSSVSRNNSGTYTCTAQNTMVPTDGGKQIGMSTRQIQVDILYTATITEFLTRDNIYEIMENNTLELYCRVDSNPYSNISLFLGDYFKSAAQESGELIYSVTAGCLEAGKYACSATNSVMDGVRVSAEVNINVLCYPRSDYRKHISSEYYVALNDNLTLVVNVIAYPEPTDIMWYHRAEETGIWQQVLNNTFPSTGLHSNISIHLGSQKDFGDYLVNMSNSLGTFEHVFHVISRKIQQGPTAFPVGAVAGGIASGVVVTVICITLIIIFLRKKVKDKPLELNGSTNETTSHGLEYEELHVNMTEEIPYQELTVISSNRRDIVRNDASGSYEDMHLYSNAGLVSDTSMNKEILEGQNVIYENTWIPR